MEFVMCALPPKTDIDRQPIAVRFVPKAEIAAPSYRSSPGAALTPRIMANLYEVACGNYNGASVLGAPTG